MSHKFEACLGYVVSPCLKTYIHRSPLSSLVPSRGFGSVMAISQSFGEAVNESPACFGGTDSLGWSVSLKVSLDAGRTFSQQTYWDLASTGPRNLKLTRTGFCLLSKTRGNSSVAKAHAETRRAQIWLTGHKYSY